MNILKHTKRPTIFVIDDEENILEIMTIVLKNFGYNVQTFLEPPEFKTIEKVRPALIFVDLLLRGNDSKKFCNDLKNNGITKDIPIVIMSAYTQAVLIEAQTQSKANDHLAKPFDISELKDVIKRNLKVEIPAATSKVSR